MKFKVLLAALFVFAGSVQCRHKMEYGSGQVSYNEKPESSVELRVHWLKVKDRGIDLGFKLRNDYKDVITMRYEDVKVEMDGERAYLRKPRAATFEITSGETIEREMIFRFDTERERRGPVKVTIPFRAGELDKNGKALPPVVIELPVR